MKDLGQEALDEMNRLLLNQKRLKMKLERMDNYGESATIKNQLADLSKTIERLQEQLKEANEIIDTLRTYDFTVDDENAEAYQVKWNVKAERFYKNRKRGVK